MKRILTLILATGWYSLALAQDVANQPMTDVENIYIRDRMCVLAIDRVYGGKPNVSNNVYSARLRYGSSFNLKPSKRAVDAVNARFQTMNDQMAVAFANECVQFIVNQAG